MVINRIEKFKNKIKELGLDAAIIYKPENRRYLSGFTGSFGYILLTHDEKFFITDSRYVEQAKRQCKGYKLIEIKSNGDWASSMLYDIINEQEIRKIGFEDKHVTYFQYSEIAENLDDIELVPLNGILQSIRMIKDDNEVENIRNAAKIVDKAFEHILNYIKPGITEREISYRIENFMKENGAYGNSFEPIIASGKRSALPHGIASHKVVEKGDFIILDYGCLYNGYCSDMTRTVVVGKASEEQKQIYNTVLDAQQSALENVKPGSMCCEIDKIARDKITNQGYGEYYKHGLGHSVGLEIHEHPILTTVSKEILEPFMTITIEPGIYIPDFGGVRIEDLVLVTENGFEVLSKSPKHLIEI